MLAADAILRARMPAGPSRMYVERSDLESVLTHYLEGPSEQYLIVAGMRGTGKSTAVQHVLRNRDGVIYIPVSKNEIDPARLVISALQASARFASPINILAQGGQDAHIATIFERAAAKHRRIHPDAPHWQPTVVVEVRGEVEGSTVAALAKHLKVLTQDLACARGVLVFSSAHDVESLPADESRQAYVRVDDLSQEEALKLLAKLLSQAGVASPKVHTEAIERILPLTTRASHLTKFASAVAEQADEAEQVAAVRAAAEERLCSAAHDVQETLKLGEADDRDLRGRQGFHAHRLMTELLETGTPVRVNETAYLEIPKQFSVKVRTSDRAQLTLKLDLVRGTVDFGTPAHRCAAAELLSKRGKPADGFDE